MLLIAFFRATMKNTLNKLQKVIRDTLSGDEREHLANIAARYWDIVAHEELKQRPVSELLHITRHHLALAATRRVDNGSAEIRAQAATS